MKKFLLLFAFPNLLFCSLAGQTPNQWNAVGGNVLGNDIHGFGIWNNQLAMGGSFNNTPCNKIATFDSTNWFCPAGGIGAVVRAVISYNGNLVAVGDFWNNNQPCTNCNGVAMWNGTAWVPLGTGFNNDVLCLAVWNGNLIAGGDFTTADGNTCYRVAQWNGSNWSAIGGLDTAFNNDVRALAVYNGSLWVGGDFTNVNGCTPCDRVVRWGGTAWVGGNSGVDIPGGLDSTVRCFYVDPQTNLLYMGGHFIEVGGNTNCSGVAVYNGSAWSALGTGVNSYVRAINKYNGNIIVGGDFTMAGSTAANRIAKWSPSSSTWSAMGTGMDQYVRAIIPYKGELYAGGSFTTAGSQNWTYIAKWYETPAVPPAASFTMSSGSICLGQCVSFTDNSSNSPTQWNWTFNGATPNSSTAQNPTNICYNTPGTYTVTLVATNGSGSSTTSQTITVGNSPPPTVTVSANPSSTICSGSSTTLTASGATTYAWSPATGLSATTGATVTASPTVTTTYTVTGTASGCSGTNTITITVNAVPLVSITPPSATICPSGSVVLTASGASTYVWSPSTGLSATTGASVTASPVSSITYTVTGTAGNGCTASASSTVTVGTTSPLPIVEGFQNLPFLPAGWTMVDNGNDGNIWQRNTSVGGFSSTGSCAWYNNNAINAPNTRDEMHTMTLDFSPYTTAQMTFDVAYCRRTNAALSDTLVVYVSTNCGQSWTQVYSKGGTTLATAPNQNASFTPTTTQWRTETVNLNAYVGQSAVIFKFQNRNHNGNNLYLDNINISGVNTNPPVSSFTMSSNTICPGGCITFLDNSANLPTTWTWTFPGGTPSSSLSQNPGNVCWGATGTYTVTLQACNANGCSTSSQTVNVSIPTVSAGSNSSICSGGNTTLNATGASSYVWTPSGSLSCFTCASPVASPTVTTTYTVIGTDANGCTNSATVTVTVNPLPPAFAGVDDTICTGGNITLNATGGASYVWTPSGSLSCSTCASPVATPAATTTYTVTVTDANGCTAADAVTITVLLCTGAEEWTASGPLIYPNPSDGRFRIAIAAQELHIEVYNVLGEKVYNGMDVRSLDLSALPKGPYAIHIHAGGQVFVRKVIIQ
ncbi:MAG: PKD domain-containing protein [Bacteroidota bacterium]